MDRRDFCKLSMGTAAAGAGLLGAAKLAAKEEPAPARPGNFDPDTMAHAARQCFLPGKRTCGEAILAAGAKALGIESELFPDLALGLGGGIGFQGDVCGTVTGSAMVISLAAARTQKDYPARMKAAMKHAGKLYNAFKAKYGCVECRKLSGLDLTTPAGRAALKAGAKAKTCGPIVEAAARLLAAELAEMHKV